MGKQRDEPQTFWQVWNGVVEATRYRYWCAVYWSLDRLAVGLAWLTRAKGSK